MSDAADLAQTLGPAKREGQSYRTTCPSCGGTNLVISEEGGLVLLKCWNGCPQEAVITALRQRNLWPLRKESSLQPVPRLRRRTDYEIRDDLGQLVAIHVRKDFSDGTKSFFWRRNGKTGLGGLKVETLPLYGAEQLAGVAPDAPLFIVEGEKAKVALQSLGEVVLGTVTGADVTPALEVLRPVAAHPGPVYLWRDRDVPGCLHMEHIAERLFALGKTSSVIEWGEAPPGGDAADFVNSGGTREELERLVSETQEWQAPRPSAADTTRRGYIKTDDKGKQILDLEALVNDLLAGFHFATLRDNEEVLIYHEGYYQKHGRRFIKAECQRRVGVNSLLTEHKVNEITEHIVRSTYVDRKDFNAGRFTLNLTNGLLDTRTRELRPHTPDYLSTIRIPVTYDANADCPAIRKFLTEVHHGQDIAVVEEIAGYCLTPDNSIQKAVLIVGGGDQGKSTELSLLKAFIGPENVSNVPWHALELNRFAISTLEGKLANIFADLPSQSLSLVSAFKMLTGGDTIGAEKKFGDYYSFVNFAKLIFSANKPPRVQDEDSYAFWRRWIILDFPNQIPEDKKDLRILDKLTTPAELSGFLNVALDGFARLRAAGRFSYNKSVEATTEYYLRAADPVYAFLQDCCEVSPKDWVTKDAMYDAFQAYCVEQSLPVTKPNSFARNLQNQPDYRVSSTRPEVDGKRKTAWQGIRICVRDVRVTRVIPSTKVEFSRDQEQGNNIVMDKRVGKNAGNLDARYKPPFKNPDATAAPVDESHCAVCGVASVYAFDPDGWPLCEAHTPPEVEPPMTPILSGSRYVGTSGLLKAEPETTELAAASETLTETDPKVTLLALGGRLGYPEGIMFSSGRGLTIAAGEAHWRKFVEGASLEEVKIALQNALKMEEVLA